MPISTFGLNYSATLIHWRRIIGHLSEVCLLLRAFLVLRVWLCFELFAILECEMYLFSSVEETTHAVVRGRRAAAVVVVRRDVVPMRQVQPAVVEGLAASGSQRQSRDELCWSSQSPGTPDRSRSYLHRAAKSRRFGQQSTLMCNTEKFKFHTIK